MACCIRFLILARFFANPTTKYQFIPPLYSREAVLLKYLDSQTGGLVPLLDTGQHHARGLQWAVSPDSGKYTSLDII
jgi:hypothetical protein